MEFYYKFILPVLNNKFFHSAVIIFGAWVICRVIRNRINAFVQKKAGQDSGGSRVGTLFGVLAKALCFVIYFLAVLFILQILFGVQPSSVIAATGIVSVALGLGAQSLVKDSINGFFVLLENQYAVGDLVTIGDFCGNVREITLRMTCVENFKGDRLYIPNGTVDRVINHSQTDRCVVIDVGVSYDEDINRARLALEEIFQRAADELDALIKAPEVMGVTSLGASSVNIRSMAFCAAGDQFAVEREMLQRVRDGFSERGISIPYNHLVVINN